eukprot:5190151-Ditylum_brightwellii.AAC.1
MSSHQIIRKETCVLWAFLPESNPKYDKPTAIVTPSDPCHGKKAVCNNSECKIQSESQPLYNEAVCNNGQCMLQK